MPLSETFLSDNCTANLRRSGRESLPGTRILMLTPSGAKPSSARLGSGSGCEQLVNLLFRGERLPVRVRYIA